MRQKMKYLTSFDQLMITLGTYKSFRTARATERELATIGTIGTLQDNQFNHYNIDYKLLRKGKQHQSRTHIDPLNAEYSQPKRSVWTRG